MRVLQFRATVTSSSKTTALPIRVLPVIRTMPLSCHAPWLPCPYLFATAHAYPCAVCHSLPCPLVAVPLGYHAAPRGYHAPTLVLPGSFFFGRVNTTADGNLAGVAGLKAS